MKSDIRALQFKHDEMTQQPLAAIVGVTSQILATLKMAFRLAVVFQCEPE